MTAISFTAREQTAADFALPSPPALRQRILVVDDDPAIRRLNTELLTASGYHVDTADDGATAWEAIQQNAYDLLVTDQEMPKLTGVGLLEKLYAARLALPVIMVTGTYPQEEFERHPWLQIEASLLKPYTMNELLDTVKNVLQAFHDDREEIAPPGGWPAA
jgi:DNA-binding response OmpR family regulator